jgi:hypothetical protein
METTIIETARPEKSPCFMMHNDGHFLVLKTHSNDDDVTFKGTILWKKTEFRTYNVGYYSMVWESRYFREFYGKVTIEV